MALFPNPQEVPAYNGAIGKSHTNLVVSEGAAPAEQFIVSKTNTATPFIYEYGPEGNQTVLIAKGKIVEADGEEVNRATGYKETAIKVAEEDTKRAIGVLHHNVYEQRRDAMEGNRPVVITRSYIEVPLFEHSDAETAATSAKAMHFGAAYGSTSELLKSGDFVVAGKDGNFKRAPEELEDFRQVVGQVLNVNRNMPPAGLLSYYTGLKSTELEDYLKSISSVPVSGSGEYPYGAPYTVGAWKKDFLKALGGASNTGIPFLTDGYFSSLQTIDVKLSEKENVETAVASKGATIEGDNVTVDGTVVDASVFVKLKHKIDPRSIDKVTVSYTGSGKVNVPARDVKVDVTNNTVVVFLDSGVTATDLTINLTASVNPVAGIPTEWDYQGSVGAARILLLR